MTFYRCSHCQFSTVDAGEPECPICHGSLTEVEDTQEDWLEKDDSSPAYF